MSIYDPPTTLGGGRFAVRRELGRGGMGIVYEVQDHERGGLVALKTLHVPSGPEIYRFKREFRVLADIVHPNLVSLYELFANDESWFFTMELLDGRGFLEHVRPGSPEGMDAARLRDGLRQLAEGVAALHQAGKVHRDLKPPNVMVTTSGRVVILDFGIAAELAPAGYRETVEEGIVGTLPYMSPEQCGGGVVGPASDCYALGVLLYEALTGTLPFTSSFPLIAFEKQESDPPPPDQIAAGLPEDLVTLCMALLSRDAAGRPSAADLLSRLGASRGAAAVTTAPPPDQLAFMGREAHLAALERAFSTACGGEAVWVYVHGPSGIGKTTLIRHFIDGLAESERANVLAGRCYVRESVPYKALDGVVDQLSRLLRSLPAAQVEALLPPDIAALVQVFPVLDRVQVVRRRAWEPSMGDRRELRRRAFTALRQLLANLSNVRPLVIHVDDVQWADQDSVDLLDHLFKAHEPWRAMFVLGFRSEELDRLEFLRSWLGAATTPTRVALGVTRLSHPDAAALAETLLGGRVEAAGEYAEIVARESDGNPFLIDQMVRFALDTRGRADVTAITIGEMLAARIGQMPEGAGEFLDVLAVAGQPVPAEIAFQAAGLPGDERPLAASLQIAHLLRASSDGARVELYHDRIRESLVRHLSGETARTIHRRLAEGFEARGVDDPEALYQFHLGAGNGARAAHHAARAARVAQQALAFERAAELYNRALEAESAPGPETGAWYVGLGDALANAGRGGEAASAYLRAVDLAESKRVAELERLAGEQLLISGRIDEGLQVIGRVLAKVGLALPRTPRGALVRLLLRRLRLRVRGLRFDEREASTVAPEVLNRIDVCWAVAEGLALVDNIQGAAFQTLHLLLALAAGEPHRIARALAIEAGFLASSGSHARSAALLDRAESLARRLESHSAVGLCSLIGGVLAYYEGDWDRAIRLVREAEVVLSRDSSFAAWQLSTAKIYQMHILSASGDIAELCRLSRRFLSDALERGNLFSAVVFRSGWSTLVWLSADDVAGARTALDEALARCPEGIFNIPYYECMLAQGMIDLYAGDGAAALRHVTLVDPRVRRSQLLRVETIRVQWGHLLGRAALAAARSRTGGGDLLSRAERVAAALEKERFVRWQAIGRLLRAGVEATRGHRDAALRLVTEATHAFASARMAWYHAAALRSRGGLLGGEEGRKFIAQADAWMAQQGMVNPERITAMLAPGIAPCESPPSGS